MNILAIAPHPDDDVIGCGGTLCHLAASGHHVTVLYLTSGDAGDAIVEPMILSRIRETEARNASAILGIHECEFLHLPDGNIQDDEPTIILLTNTIRRHKPDMIFIPHATDGHKDHQTTYRLLMESIYRSGARAHQSISGTPWRIPTVLTYEVWTPLPTVSYAEDITDVIGKKMDAIKAHASQLKNVAYDQAMIGLHQYRAATQGVGQYAECFFIVRIDKIW